MRIYRDYVMYNFFKFNIHEIEEQFKISIINKEKDNGP